MADHRPLEPAITVVETDESSEEEELFEKSEESQKMLSEKPTEIETSVKQEEKRDPDGSKNPAGNKDSCINSQWCKNIAIVLCLQYFIVAFGIGISFTLELANSDFENNCSFSQLGNSKVQVSRWGINCTAGPELGEYIDSYITFLVVISVFGFFAITIFDHKCLCCGARPKRNPYLLGGTILFGTVAAVWFLLRALGNTEKYRSSPYVSAEIYSALEVFFIFTQIFFLAAHGGESPNSMWIKAFIVHVAATNFCLWFRITVSEARERQSKIADACHATTFEAVCMPTSSRTNAVFETFDADQNISFRAAVERIAESAMPFMYPFIAEFCLCASGLLLKCGCMQIHRQISTV